MPNRNISPFLEANSLLQKNWLRNYIYYRMLFNIAIFAKIVKLQFFLNFC